MTKTLRNTSLELYPLDKLLIFNAIYLEISTYAQAAAYKNKFTGTIIDLDWCAQLDETLQSASFRLGSQGESIKTSYSVSILKEVLQISRYYQDGSQSFLKPVSSIDSLTAFLVLNALDLASQQCANGELKIETKQKTEVRYFAAIVNTVSDIERRIASEIGRNNQTRLIDQSDWGDVSSIIHALPQIVKLKRQPNTTLVEYQRMQQRGVLKRRLVFRPRNRKRFFGEELGFQSPPVLVTGNVTKLNRGQRSVTADFVKIDGRQQLASVLSRPDLFSDVLPYERNRCTRFLVGLRTHRAITGIGIYVIVVVGTMFFVGIQPGVTIPLLIVPMIEPSMILVERALFSELLDDIVSVR